MPVRETPERVAATSSQPHAFRSAACARLRHGETAAHSSDSDGHPMANTKGHESSIRRSRTLPPLRGGSQHRSGRTHIFIARIARQVRSAHAPLAAKGRPMRTPKWRFGVGHVRQQPRSLAERQHPSRSSHERLDPIAHCGRPSKRERVGPTPTRHTRQRTHRFIGVKSDLAHALRSGCRHLRPFAPAGRARIARQAWAAHRWAIGIRVLRSTNVNGMCVGPC